MSAQASTSLTAEQFVSLQASIRGTVIAPDAADYAAARHVNNAAIDRHPALIVRCVDVADVIATVTFAREQGLPVAVRSGGHNVAGLGTCDSGVVIDLARMKGIRVDPQQRTARVEAGCSWGDFDHATHVFGLATPGGLVSTTGVAGLTLGGGFGHLSRHYGLACDNLLSADVVTADGRFLTASPDEHADLFWGLRGGGGNFGVVTSFEFRLHPVGLITGGPIFFPVEQAPAVLRGYREAIAAAPETVSALFAYLIVPPIPMVPEKLHWQVLCAIVVCYDGVPEQADAAIAPFRACGQPTFELVGLLPYPVLQGLFDAVAPPGLYHYWKSEIARELSDDLIAVHTVHGPGVPNIFTAVHIYPLNGAVQRVGPTETAFPHRNMGFVQVVAATTPDPAELPWYTTYARDYWAALHPVSGAATYVNFLMEEGDERVRAAYGDNYERLVALKQRYDPDNVFRFNQNIAPSHL